MLEANATSSKAKHIHLWSDGCGGQFKNKYLKHFLRQCSNKYKVNLHHHYFQSCHGKGACDSECAVLKCGCRFAERHGGYLEDSRQVYEWLVVNRSRPKEKFGKKSRHSIKSRHFYFIQDGEIDHYENTKLGKLKGVGVYLTSNLTN